VSNRYRTILRAVGQASFSLSCASDASALPHLDGSQAQSPTASLGAAESAVAMARKSGLPQRHLDLWSGRGSFSCSSVIGCLAPGDTHRTPLCGEDGPTPIHYRPPTSKPQVLITIYHELEAVSASSSAALTCGMIRNSGHTNRTIIPNIAQEQKMHAGRLSFRRV